MSNNKPPEPANFGPKWFRELFNGLRDLVMRNQVEVGEGLIVSDIGGGQGRRLEIERSLIVNRGQKIYHPWQAIRTGAFTFTLRKGFVLAFDEESISPSNMNATFTCPANNSTGFFVWLQGNFSGVPELTSLTLGSGTVLPTGPAGDPETGAPPAVSYCPIIYATSTADGIDSIVYLTTSIIKVELALVAANCASNQRAIHWRSLDGSLLA